MLKYSVDALNVLDKFYSGRKIIYVEGDDDISFWGKLCDQIVPGIEVEIIKAGNSNSLAVYISDIVEHDANIMAFADSDFTQILNLTVDHTRVVYTFGYSIENTLYSAKSICCMIENLSKTRRYPISSVEEWKEAFSEGALDLCAFELADIQNGTGIGAMGNSSAKFIKNSGGKCLLCNKKIQKTLEQKILDYKVKNSHLEKASKIIERSGYVLWNLIRGHFLEHALMNFIKREFKKNKNTTVSLSREAFFAYFIAELDYANLDTDEESTYYESSIRNALRSTLAT